MQKIKLPILYTGNGSAIENYNKINSGFVPSHKEETKPENWGLFDKNNQQHKTILSLMRQAQWTRAHERHAEVADLNRLSEFLKSDKSPVKKPLKEMTSREVSKIIVALIEIVIHRFK
ncbi:hypothetical protein OIU83_10725 [Flavobacterium sp. LS1R49]|uniref:Uncharacterized protein n=1 Tax=Flavobacterium shii TaxID=2987687 RepID=A0A9X2ZCP1_9FLAO|nr:hypothetical protein [Flavobacterium shii]MCV9928130.1 hypothetical protein [Flavobacterium shii]